MKIPYILDAILSPKLGPLQLKWVRALESGEYKQGDTLLYNRDRDQYCCLGVLYRILGVDIERDSCGLNEDIVEMFGFNGDLGYLKPHQSYCVAGIEVTFVSLASMNDNEVSFKAIAKFIRQNPELVFTKKV